MRAGRRGQHAKFGEQQAILVGGGATKADKSSAINYFRELFSLCPEPPAAFDHNLIDVFIRILHDEKGDTEMRCETAHIVVSLLGNMCSSKAARCTPLTHTFIDKGIVNAFKKCIKSADQPTALRASCVAAALAVSEGCVPVCKGALGDLMQPLAMSVTRGSIATLDVVTNVMTLFINTGQASKSVVPYVLAAGAAAVQLFPADNAISQANLTLIAGQTAVTARTAYDHDLLDVAMRKAGTIDFLIGVATSGEPKSQKVVLKLFVRFLENVHYARRTDQRTVMLSNNGLVNCIVACTGSDDARMRVDAVKALRHLDPDLSNDQTIATILRLVHEDTCQSVHDQLHEFVSNALASAVRDADAHERLTNLLTLGLLDYIVRQVCRAPVHPYHVHNTSQWLRTLLGARPQFWRVIERQDGAATILGLVPPVRVRRAADYCMEDDAIDL